MRRTEEQRRNAEREAEQEAERFGTPVSNAPFLTLPVDFAFSVPKDVKLTSRKNVHDEEVSVVEWTDEQEVRKPFNDCLRAFCQLAKVDKEQDANEWVRDFVREWGALGIQPYYCWTVQREGRAERWFADRIKMYRYLSALANSLIDTALDLRAGKTIYEKKVCKVKDVRVLEEVAIPVADVEMWLTEMVMETFVRPLSMNPEMIWSASAPSLKMAFSFDTKEWDARYQCLELKSNQTEVDLFLKNDDDLFWPQIQAYTFSADPPYLPFRFKHDFRPSRLFAALSVQLLAALTGQQDWYRCGVCNKTYPRYQKKRPAPGDMSFCEDGDCREEADRARKRKWAREHKQVKAESA